MMNLPPLIVMPWKQFSENPGQMFGLFDNVPNRLIYDPTKVIVGLDPSVSNWADKCHRTFTVTNAEELEQLDNRLSSVPILLRKSIVLKKEEIEVRFLSRVRKITYFQEEFALLINTKHPVIQQNIKTQLHNAAEHIENGKRFCTTISFGPSLVSWLKRLLIMPSSQVTSQSDSDAIYITNHTLPTEAFTSLIWCFTCPCFFLPFCISKGIYHCVRKSTDKLLQFKDLEIKVLIARDMNQRQARENLTLGLLQMLAQGLSSSVINSNEDPPPGAVPVHETEHSTIDVPLSTENSTEGRDEATRGSISYAGLRWVPAQANAAANGDPMEEYMRRLQRHTAMSQVLAHLRQLGAIQVMTSNIAAPSGVNAPVEMPATQPPIEPAVVETITETVEPVHRPTPARDKDRKNKDKAPEIELSDSESETGGVSDKRSLIDF